MLFVVPWSDSRLLSYFRTARIDMSFSHLFLCEINIYLIRPWTNARLFLPRWASWINVSLPFVLFCQRIHSIIVAGTYSWLLPSFRTSWINVGFPVFFFNQMDRLVIVARPHSHGSIYYSSLSEHVSFSTLAKMSLRLIRPGSWNQSDWRSASRL